MLDLKSKQAKVLIVISLVILLPIVFNKTKTAITAIGMSIKARQPKVVQVMSPQKKAIYPNLKTTGRVEAKYAVDVIARVNGWLENRFFNEGDIVKKGQKLFLIEPDEYILAARNAQATVNENKAVYANSQIELKRATQLVKEDLVSRSYYDDALATRNKNRAALDGAKAELSKARLDLSYTNVKSPMDGRIGKILITEGNYVTAQSGVITTIYSTNPIKVTFSLQSADFIFLKRLMLEREKHEKVPVIAKLELADGSTYDTEGKIEFVDNKIDENSGTVSLIAIFENKNEILVPGDFVNVILTFLKTKEVMLVPQSATGNDVGTGYYVWVVQDGKAVRKSIKVKESLDENWIVESGLNYDDKVVVKGLQSIIKTGQPVKVEEDVPNKKAGEEK